ncbi:MAG: hypothetical protein L3J20_00950 [Flavobacteriaceae bacterium]|nr:hypothetical protein [Flavobacteriaceae bacterium]
MSIIAKMYVDNKVINILVLTNHLYQKTDWTGKPNGIPMGGLFQIIFESDGDTLFFEWMVSEDMMKEVKLIFSPVIMNGKSRTIQLYDTHCVGYEEYFSSTTDKPITTTLILSPGIIVENNEILLKKHWRISDPFIKKVAPTSVPKEEEPKIIDYYLTDVNNNKIEKAKIGDIIILNIKTKDLIGEILNINLNDKTVDFKYNGELLINDTLTGLKINSNLEKIELEVVKQQ